RRIVRDDHCLVALNHSDAGDETGAGRLVVIHAVGCKRAELEKRRVRIEDVIDAFADKHLAAFLVAFDCSFAAALLNDFESGSKVGNEFSHAHHSALQIKWINSKTSPPKLGGVPASFSEQAGWFQSPPFKNSAQEPPHLAALGTPPNLGGEFRFIFYEHSD